MEHPAALAGVVGGRCAPDLLLCSPSPLAQADLGMAIGNGTDIAIEAAGMVLMGSSLAGVVTAIDVSRAIHRRIWTNFGWAFVYNLVRTARRHRCAPCSRPSAPSPAKRCQP